MNEQLFIPETIKVGFQKRNDTYTKSLGYVVYIDEKGKLRKEASWNSWRDKSIEPKEFKNEPTEGFVLNRNVGGKYTYSYQTRVEKVRVYDPRGFEFEIAIPNLLYILQECTSAKGKGLEGKFVYSWQGTELVLLPVDSEVYKSSTQYTTLQKQKSISVRDLKLGYTYIDKYSNEYIYLGKYEWYETRSKYSHENNTRMFGRCCHYIRIETKTWIGSLQHIFYDCKLKVAQPYKPSLMKEVKSTTVAPNFAELVQDYTSSEQASYPIKIVSKDCPTLPLFRHEVWGDYPKAVCTVGDTPATINYYVPEILTSEWNQALGKWKYGSVNRYNLTSELNIKLDKETKSFVIKDTQLNHTKHNKIAIEDLQKRKVLYMIYANGHEKMFDW
jgi:hypothetical protein